MAIFVTGGAGFIGCQFIRNWIGQYPAQTVIAILEKGRSGATYHIGGRNPRTNREVLGMVLRSLGRSEDLLTPVTDRMGHGRRCWVENAESGEYRNYYQGLYGENLAS
jgi:dTDP-D-glucose 4,6-dehydratase